MNISVASDTGCGRGLERHFGNFAARNTGLVAFVALNSYVCSDERKRRLGMVKAGKIGP